MINSVGKKNEEVEESSETKQIEDYVVLKNIDLKVRKGEFLAIIGEVGSGKSSIISSVIGDTIYVDK